MKPFQLDSDYLVSKKKYPPTACPHVVVPTGTEKGKSFRRVSKGALARAEKRQTS